MWYSQDIVWLVFIKIILRLYIEIYEKLSDVRRNLRDLEGEESISTIMFKVGSVYNNADWCEDEVSDIINSFNDDSCDEYEDDNLIALLNEFFYESAAELEKW